MQTGTAQYLSDLDLAQCRAQSLEPLHGVSDEIWKPVDWSAGIRFDRRLAE
jgi:hypothetical protein